MAENIHLLGESPISGKIASEDLFNFKHYADKVKKIIQLNSNSVESLSIGIYGKWGEGKTSFLNIIKHKIEHFEKDENGKEYLAFDFNPWRYSSEEEMLSDFFDGIAKRFYVEKKTNSQKIGDQIAKYSKYLKAIKISATVGMPKVLNSKIEFNPDKIFEALGGDLAGEQITIEKLKIKVNNAINEANFKVIIFIDDLDRLDKDEIYTILKLIKLNANFNNFIFIITLDTEHVSKAIKHRYGDDIEDGKLFLEKIINIPIHLPKIEDEDLQLFFETKFNQIIKFLDAKDYGKKENELREVVQKFSSSYFNSPREIIRVINGFFIGAFGFEDEINLTDLFWIEWVKVKNESLYNDIKNYNSFGQKAVFNNQDILIDFNDEIDLDIDKRRSFNVGDEVNGTRKAFFEKYPQCQDILELLFPNRKSLYGNTLIFDQNLNINSVYHFNKYFSFHTERKVSNTITLKIKKSIEDKNTVELKAAVENLFSNQQANQQSYFTLQNLIKSYNVRGEVNISDRNFFYQFICENISLVPLSEEDVFGIDNRSRIVELIAIILNEDVENDNKEVSLSIANHLDLYQLCYFTRKFKDGDSPFKNLLETLIYQKAVLAFDAENPIFFDVRNPIKMIMHYWRKESKETFDKHIESTLTDLERIKKLIRNFAPFWNNTYYGPLEKENYDYIKSLLDVDFIFNQLSVLDPKIVENVDIKTFEFPLREESTIEENLIQFIYFYKKEKNDLLLL